MGKYGFKEINPANWLQPDPVLRAFVRMLPDGQSRPVTGDEYLSHILEPRLLESVPIQVQALFEVSRGAMAYGYFFYPLYTLAAEQLSRVAEAAIVHQCKAMGAPTSKDTFKRRLNWLVDNGAIPRLELIRWDAVRKLRNAASHPDGQSILTPGNAVGLLERVAEQINSLFGNC